MKKNIIISLLVVVFLIGTVFGYKNINQMFPPRELKTIKKGSEIEFRDSVDISVSKMRWLSEEEKKVSYSKSRMNSEVLDYDTEITEITVILNNNTDKEVKVPMTDLYLEGIGIGNGISKEILDGDPDYYGSLNQTLNPGEKKEVKYPYVIPSLWFHDKDWEKIKDRDFWLTFSSYPEKTVLCL